MENLRLLEIHRKKISIKFTIFILISIWLIQAIFVSILYINDDNKLKQSLVTKYEWVENILNNKEKYTQLIIQDNWATKLILEKSLDWVTIYENNKRILWDININNIPLLNYFDTKNNKYYQNTSNINNINYQIIIEINNINTMYHLIKELLYFIALTLPFSVLLYYIWYKFVWSNFKPIQDTINSLETFTWNINHEMKTPIAEIISTLSLSQKIKWNYEESIQQSLDSTHRLNKILDSMLWIINLVDADYQKEKTSINWIIKHIVNQNKESIKSKNITINNNLLVNNIYKILNKQHLELCIWNILSNAVKYSHNNSIINIDYRNNEIIIQDYWIWIKKNNLKNIYNSYFRENYTHQEGYWLWLALVKKITDINKWDFKIISEKEIGTIVKIKIDN